MSAVPMLVMPPLSVLEASPSIFACTRNDQCVSPQACFGMVEVASGTLLSSACSCPASIAFTGANCDEPTTAVLLFFAWIIILFCFTALVWVYTGVRLWRRVDASEKCGARALFAGSAVVLAAMAVHRAYVLASMHDALTYRNEPWQAGFYLFLSDTFLVFSNLVLLFDGEDDDDETDENEEGEEEKQQQHGGVLSKVLHKICLIFLPNAVCLAVVLAGNYLDFANKEMVTNLGLGCAWLTLLVFVVRSSCAASSSAAAKKRRAAAAASPHTNADDDGHALIKHDTTRAWLLA